MHKVNCEIEILTPMFLGGVDGKTPELRTQSIKGLLRFWWRAYKYGQIQDAVNTAEKLKALKMLEVKIFGSITDGGNKSSFAISVSTKKIKESMNPLPNLTVHKVPVPGKSFPVNILKYLCYGTYDNKGKFTRGYFLPNQRFNLIIRIDNKDYEEDILIAVYLLCEFGGAGSRSRNGFGGLSILNKNVVFEKLTSGFSMNIFLNKDFLKEILKLNEIPPFTAFSNKMKLFKTKGEYSQWDECLADLGKAYKSSREALEPRHIFKKRQYIGAPLDPPKGKEEAFKSLLERHSKPYFLKVSKNENGNFYGNILFVPSLYCFNVDKDRNSNKISKDNENKNFQSVCNTFNQFLTKDSRLEVVL